MLPTMPVKDRKEKLALLEEAEVETGAEFQASLVEITVKEMQNVEDIIAVLCPYVENERFKLTAPRLGATALAEVDRATLCLRLMAQEKFRPLVQNNEESKADLLSLCQGVLEMIKRKPADISVVLDGAMEELNRIALYFIALNDPLHHMTDSAIEVIQSLKKSKQGAKTLLKHAVQQSTYWKGLEAQFLKVQMAQKAHGPEVEAALTALREGKMSGVKEIVEKIPVWRDAMGKEALDPMVNALNVLFQSELTRFKAEFTSKTGELADDDASALRGFIAQLEFAYNMLGLALSVPKAVGSFPASMRLGQVPKQGMLLQILLGVFSAGRWFHVCASLFPGEKGWCVGLLCVQLSVSCKNSFLLGTLLQNAIRELCPSNCIALEHTLRDAGF